MAPKIRPGTQSKANVHLLYQHISQSSLIRFPELVIEGYEERIFTGIAWNNIELSYRHLTEEYDKDPAEKKFYDAFLDKVGKSSAGSVMREDLSAFETSELNQTDKFDLMLDEDEKAIWCYRNTNYFVDDIDIVLQKIRRESQQKNVLINKLLRVNCLRLMKYKITEIDKNIHKFVNLTMLNLGCNFITEVDIEYLPHCLKILELNGNRIHYLAPLVKLLPSSLIYLGLSRNLIDDETDFFSVDKCLFSILDLSDNDILNLEYAIDDLRQLPRLFGISLYGNPCSMGAGYATYVRYKMPRLKWLDSREIRANSPVPPGTPISPSMGSNTKVGSEELLDSDKDQPVMPEQLRATFFTFAFHRVIGIPPPPKLEKGISLTYHIELELPLIDGQRRQFLMARRVESLITSSAVEVAHPSASVSLMASKTSFVPDSSNISIKSAHEDSYLVFAESDIGIYKDLAITAEHETINYRVYKTNEMPWSNVITFQEPTLKVFVPDMKVLRDTFRTEVTLRLVCTVTTTERKDKSSTKRSKEMTIAKIKCQMQMPDWGCKWIEYKWEDGYEDSMAVYYPEEYNDRSYTQNMKTASKTPCPEYDDIHSGLSDSPVDTYSTKFSRIDLSDQNCYGTPLQKMNLFKNS